MRYQDANLVRFVLHPRRATYLESRSLASYCLSNNDLRIVILKDS